MKAPDLTYRFVYPKDVAGPTFGLLFRRFDDSQVATSVNAQLQGIPKDRILVISNLSVSITPGAAQTPLLGTISGFTAAGAQVNIHTQAFTGAAGAPVTQNWQGEAMVLGRGAGVQSVNFRVTFDLGGVANAATWHIFGYVIPRGNSYSF